MGRTMRRRRRRRKLNLEKLKENTGDSLIRLKTWLLNENCSSIRHLVPENFPVTGRGLKTLKHVESNQILIELPFQALITTDVLLQSDVQLLFLNNITDSFSSQSILSVFLVYEAHLGMNSKWYLYLQTLPRSFTNPDFCSNREKKVLPDFILDALRRAHRLEDDFALIAKAIQCLEVTGRSRCSHCNAHFRKIIRFARYKWAYYVVNTRAVYIDAKLCMDNGLNIKQPNNLALAPFLDLFNHDVSAVVRVSIVENKDQRQGDRFYRIVTSKSFDAGSQVFINYGAHDNLRLYIDYGFFIPRNPLDEIRFDVSDVQRCFDVSKSRLDFVTSNSFHKNMSFSRDGLNYNATATIFVSSTKLERQHWKLKIYGEIFDSAEQYLINELGISILNMKKFEYARGLNNMKETKCETQSFLIAINLVEEYLNILDISLNSMKRIQENLCIQEKKNDK